MKVDWKPLPGCENIPNLFCGSHGTKKDCPLQPCKINSSTLEDNCCGNRKGISFLGEGDLQCLGYAEYPYLCK